MSTYVNSAAAGELRWYSSFSGSVLTNAWTPSNTDGGSVIESVDLY
jgi:hypothetical protein